MHAISTYDHYMFVTIMTFVIHEGVYFARYIPFYILEMMPSMSKYKLQAVRSLAPAVPAAYATDASPTDRTSRSRTRCAGSRSRASFSTTSLSSFLP